MKKSVLASAFALVASLSLASCQELQGSISFDAAGGELIWYPENSSEPEVLETDNPIFDLFSGFPTYAAIANSELPREISTLQARKAGYHFSGWGQVVNGEVTGSYLSDFSSARMPYTASMYRAVYAPLTSVTFVPVDEEGNRLNIGGQEIAELTYSGEDCYVGSSFDNTSLNAVLTQMTSYIPEDYRSNGEFVGIYDAVDSETALGVINIEAENPTYYVKWSDYPYFTIHYNDGVTPDKSVQVRPGASLTPYLPTENPEKANAVFDQWYIDEDFKTSFYEDDYLLMSSSNLDIYAKFFDEIPLTFDLPEGYTLETSQLTVLTGNPIGELPTPSAPEGESFSFWYCDEDGDGVYTKGVDTEYGADTVVPEGIDELVLKPASEEWSKVYLDIRGFETYFSSMPTGFEEIEDGIYQKPYILGDDIGSLYSIDSYVWDETAFGILRFETYVVKKDDEAKPVLDLVDATEAGPSSQPLSSMPDASVVIKPLLTDKYKLTLNYRTETGESISSEVYLEEGTFVDDYTGFADGIDIPDIPHPSSDYTYVCERLTGWYENGELLDSYPYEVNHDAVLDARYQKIVQATFRNRAGDATLFTLEGSAGEVMSYINRQKVSDAYQSELEENERLVGFYYGKDGEIIPFNTSFRYPERNLDLVPVIMSID